MKNEEKIDVLRKMYSDNLQIIAILDNISTIYNYEMFKQAKPDEIPKIAEAKETKNRQINNAWKILNNPKIMEFIESEGNIEFLRTIIQEDNKSYENLCILVERVYGEDAKKIIQERPELTMRDIPNFDIFEEQIREQIGYGGVHTFLTYYMDSEHVITDIARNSDLMKYYDEFEKMTTGFFPPSAIGLEEKLLAFDRHKGLIKQIIDSGRKEEYVSNLLLFLRDEEGYSMISSIEYYDKNEQKNLYPFEQQLEGDFRTETLEQLTAYRKRREDILDHYIDICLEKIKSPQTAISRIIMFKHFGILKDSPGEYKGYDHKKFLEDYLTFNKTELTGDEVDLVELYSILEDIDDPEILIQIDRFLSGREDVVTPLKMKTIDDKVTENYKREYVDSLLTIEQAREMAENPENESYRYIYKENGDICYPDHRECSDGTKKYEDFIEEKNGNRIYQYKGKNGECITVTESKDGTQRYEIENVELNSEGNVKFRGKISIVMRNGQIEEYFFPTHPSLENEEYGLKKNSGQEKYGYEAKVPVKGDSNSHDIYYMGTKNNPQVFIRKTINNEDGKIKKTEWVHQMPEMMQWRGSIDLWKDNVEVYLHNLVQQIELAKNQKDIEAKSYFEKIPQYTQDEFQLEEGDVEGFVLYGVNKEQLCISMQRGDPTSEQLAENKLLKGKENGLKERIYIEKHLEGGISSRSFYYSCTNPANSNYPIGIGVSKIDPNSIIGFSLFDAMTSHSIKSLRVIMAHEKNSNILSQQSNSIHQSELATLRYEYDITKIRERNRGRKSCTRLYMFSL